MEAMAQFYTEQTELICKINMLQVELIEGLYNFIIEYGRIFDVKDVFDF